MQEEFVRDIKIKDKTEIEKEIELVKNIIKVNEELTIANENFQFVEDELVDYYTYQIKANQSKLNYLLKVAKTMGITNNMLDQLKIKLTNEQQDVG